MNKKYVEYSYIDFKHNILYLMKQAEFNQLVEDFVYKYHANRSLLESKFGETYLNNLIQAKLPKIIRTDAYNKDRYAEDMWHLYIMANWSQDAIYSLKQSTLGSYHWKTEWDDEKATRFNNQCYLGEY